MDYVIHFRVGAVALVLTCLLAAGCDDDVVPPDAAMDLDVSDFAAGDLAPPSNQALPSIDGGVAEVEPALAVSGPTAVAAYMTISDRGRVATARSDDDGRTWRSTGELPVDGGEQAIDPSVAIDSTGVAHAAYLTVPSGSPVDVWQVSWNGAGWSARTRVSDPEVRDRDNPWLTIAPDDTLALVYSEELPPDGSGVRQLVVARSIDGGATFSRVAVPAADAQVQAAAFDTMGRLHVAFVTTALALGYVRSDDGGRTFGAPVGDLLQVFNDARPAIAADAQQVYLVALARDPVDVVLFRSIDGRTFQSTTVAAGDVTEAPLLNPAVALAGGALAVGYYGADITLAGRWKIALSVDGGRSFGPPRTISDADLTFTLSRLWPDWLGDYEALTSSGGRFYTLFTDNREGSSHVWFAGPLP